MKSVTIGDMVTLGSIRGTVVGFNVHGLVVVGYKDMLGVYQRRWVSKEDIVICK
jgi:hypothetical protein